MSPAERAESIKEALYKAHSLSRALDYMTEIEPRRLTDTWRASVEEVNNAAYAAIIAAIDHAEILATELGGTS